MHVKAWKINPSSFNWLFTSIGLRFRYQINNVTFTEHTSIESSMRMQVFSLSAGKELVFSDPDSSDASLLPPATSWGANDRSHLLNGVRLSSTVATAYVDLANDLGYFNHGSTAQILDAKLLINITMDTPVVSVPNEPATADRMEIDLPSGLVEVRCATNQTDQGLNGPIMFKFLFFNASINAKLQYTSSPAAGIIAQVEKWNLAGTTIELKQVLYARRFMRPFF